MYKEVASESRVFNQNSAWYRGCCYFSIYAFHAHSHIYLIKHFIDISLYVTTEISDSPAAD